MKTLKYIGALLLTIGLSISVMAQQTPAAAQSEVISITGATAHVGDGTVIENAVIVMENGLIKAIGAAGSVEAQGKVIEASGKHVYPGFILANSTLGLGEIDAVRATRDFDELGAYLPHVRSLIAYNAESKVIESLRPNGILLAQITPRGGSISGTSSIVQLDAWNWEDAVIVEDDALHLNWPELYKLKYEAFGSIRISGENEKYTEQVAGMVDFLQQAKAYTPGGEQNRNLPFEATQGIFDQSKKVFLHVERKAEILDGLAAMQALGLKNVTLVGAYEAYQLIDELKAAGVSVLVKRVHSLPNLEDDDYDQSYKTAAFLAQNGILTALENSGQMERMNGRNLPFYAGTLTAHGLSSEEALSLITLNAAEILGIADKYGSLTTGKSATLFISKGDALDMRGNQLEQAWIDGRGISLETHQTELWKRYMGKFEAQKAD